MRRDTPQVVLAGLLFLLSGAAALVYQVAWQRLLVLHSGVGLYSVAMIVAAFMAGIGVGSLVGGRLSARTGAPRALQAFAILELLVGAFGAASTGIYYDWLYPWAVHLPGASWQAGLLHFVALLPPTLLMGMSLPFLVRAVVTDVEGASRRIGWLYGINMLGAAAGALATPWWLLPAWGVPGAVLVAAGANGLVGLGALALGWLPRGPDRAPAEEPRAAAPPSAEAPGERPLALWLALYALSGFVALSLEIVWFRLLDVAVKSTAFTFGTLLAVYLFGSAVGSLAGAPLARRLRRPLQVFLLVQCTLVGLSALAVIALVVMPPRWPLVAWYLQYWAAYEFFPLGHDSDPVQVTRLYVLLPLLLFFVPTVLMGFSFPVLQRAVQDDPAASGHRVGTLQAANIAGCTVGSLLVGLLTLAVLGTSGTIQLLVGAGAVFALVGLWHYGRSFVVPVLGLVLLGALVPDSEAALAPPPRPHRGRRARLLRRRRHRGGGADPRPGRGVAALGQRQGEQLAALRARAHRPRGGSGVGPPRPAAGGHRGPGVGGHRLGGLVPSRDRVDHGLRDLTAAAAHSVATRGLRRHAGAAVSPRGLPAPHPSRGRPQGPRVRSRHLRPHRGRRDLAARPRAAATSTRSSSSRRWPAGSSQGGVMCTWAPTPRVYRTFRTVFPHVIEDESGGILIGSRQPIPFEPEAWLARAAAGEAYLGAGSHRGREGGPERLPAGVGIASRGPSTAISSPATSSRCPSEADRSLRSRGPQAGTGRRRR